MQQNPAFLGTLRCWRGSQKLGIAPLALAVLGLVMGTGCPGGDGAKNSVSGKVTLNGKPVAGTVVFIGADNSEVGTSPIGPEGNYTIVNPTPGPVKILVKGKGAAGSGPGVGPVIAPPKGGPTTPDMPGTTQGENPPPKYGNAASTPLTYEVKPGKQTYDIPLNP